MNAAAPVTLGRYEMLGALARGGMATVYLGRHSGEAGFKRLYAIKVMHAHLADDNSFIEMLLDEARIAARLHHPNVVPIVDLGSQDGSHYVVMEYIEGCSLSALLTKYRDSRPPRLIIPLILDALAGLHAAHSLTDDEGTSLQLVHRDVSPQNVLVGVDGSARIIDFGIAKATSKVNSTRPGQMKGKLAFMAPEQLRDASNVDARTDVWAAGAMLWSALTGRKLFLGDSDAETLNNILTREIPKPSTVGFQPPAELDDVVMRALERDPTKRWQTAADMEDALREAAEKIHAIGSKREIAEWLNAAFGEELAERRSIIRGTDAGSRPSTTSQVSGFRMIPTLGANTTFTPSHQSGASRANDEIPVETELLEPNRKRFIVPAAVGVLLLALGIGLAVRRGEPATPVATAPAATTTAAASAGAATTAAATATATAAATATGPSAPAHATAATPPRTTPAWAAAVPAAKAAKPTTTTAAAAPAAPPPAAEPKKKAWDSDSPLPPQ